MCRLDFDQLKYSTSVTQLTASRFNLVNFQSVQVDIFNLAPTDMWPEDIEPHHIYRFMRERNANVRANRDVAVLSNIMVQAIRMGLINANPCKQVRRNEEKPRTREVLDKEITAFLPHCPTWLKAYIRLKLLTGLRQADLLNIRKEQLRDDGLYVETGKRGKRLLFIWTDDLRTAVENFKTLHQRVSSPYLINSERNGTQLKSSGFKSAWARAMAKAREAGALTDTFAENDLRAKERLKPLHLDRMLVRCWGTQVTLKQKGIMSAERKNRSHFVRSIRQPHFY